MCGSRFISETESRYAMVELELKSVEWAVKNYLIGLPFFTLVVYHQPLVCILDRYTLDAVENLRLQRMKEKLSPYVFKTVWRKGSQHSIPDALSRATVTDPTEEDIGDENELNSHVRSVVAACVSALQHRDNDSSPPHLPDTIIDKIREAANKGADYKLLVQMVKDGFPRYPDDLPAHIRQCLKLRHQLSTDDGLVFVESRIVIPAVIRRDVLNKLHVAHQGIERTKRRARQTGLTSDIVNAVRACEACQQMLPSIQQEPYECDPPPTRVFEDTSADLFSYAGHQYLVYVDRYSGWPCVRVLPSRRLISRRYRSPDELLRWSRRTKPTKNWRRFWILIRRVQPVRQTVGDPVAVVHSALPPIQCHAEAAVKAIKSLLIK